MHASLVCQNGIEFSEQSVLILLGDIPYTVSRKLKTDINTLQDSIVLTLRASPQAVGYGVHVYIYIYQCDTYPEILRVNGQCAD